MTEQNNSAPQGYFPFAAPANFKADYLQLVMQQGGEAARAYKGMSYDLLMPGEGMQVLDVGCGIGIDLFQLADRVGRQGQVVGLELDPDLVRAAQRTIVEDTHPQVQVAQGAAWEDIHVQAINFTHTVWSVVDMVFQISATARAFVHLDPTYADEIEAWLKAIEAAAQQEAFFASVPLFYAYACKTQASL